MNLTRKLEIARSSIASITRHDDASEKEIAECAVQLQKFITTELAAAADRREKRDVERTERLKEIGDGDAH